MSDQLRVDPDFLEYADQVVGWNDPEIQRSYHELLIRNIRNDAARMRARYEALPWWRRLITRRPKHPLCGGSSADA